MTTSSKRKRPRAPRQRAEIPTWTPLTDRELFLRVELSFFQDQLQGASDLDHLTRNRKVALNISPKQLVERLVSIFERGFDAWDTLCNENCKSMYFCSRPRGHKGHHGTDGLVWDQKPPSKKRKKKR